MENENKLAEQKAALLSIKTAHQNILQIIKRVENLERALESAAADLKKASDLTIGYQYKSEKTNREYFQGCELNARNALLAK